MAQKKQIKSKQEKEPIFRKRIKPELPGGFRDYGPSEAIARAQMIETIRKTFESFGFDPLETSSVQRTEVLTGGEEDSGKIIFNVKGSQEEISDNSLRFDLTVPLARFVAANPDIPKPFKRYEIGRVWRGERPQAGRYREFMQADVDIVGSSAIDADAEMIIIIDSVLKKLGLSNFIIKINNRKSYDTLPDKYQNFPDNQRGNMEGIMREIDKADKIGIPAALDNISKFYGGSDTSGAVQEFFEDKEIIPELRDLENIAKQNGVENIKIDKTIVRGLSYYTGSVFETILTDASEIGSIAGGGRYDGLVAKFTGQNIPSVGVSFGVDRLFAVMEKLGKLGKRQTNTSILILQLNAALKNDYFAMAQELRKAEVNTALYLGDDTSFQAQLAYAVKKEIPFVIIYGEEEKKKAMVAVKNLTTREQKEIKRGELADFFAKQFGKK